MKVKFGVLISALAGMLCLLMGIVPVYANPDETAAETAEITVQEHDPVKISLAVQSGYILPEQLTLKIGETQYSIYTDWQN